MSREHPRPKLAPMPQPKPLKAPPAARPKVALSPTLKTARRCFWCAADLWVAKRTVDHLISRPLMHRLGRTDSVKVSQRNSLVVACCWDCNQKRARISSMYRVTCCFQAAAKHGTIPRRRINRFLSRLRRLAELLDEWDALILERASKRLQPVLLIEIHELRAFAALPRPHVATGYQTSIRSTSDLSAPCSNDVSNSSRGDMSQLGAGDAKGGSVP